MKVLVLIDEQNDFVTPGGSLFIPGAPDATEYIHGWIRENRDELDHMVLSQDSHPVCHISFYDMWSGVDQTGPSTHFISEIYNKTALYTPKIKGLPRTPSDGMAQFTLWPRHCVSGTHGSAMPTELEETLKYYIDGGKRHVEIYRKGENSQREAYSMFSETFLGIKVDTKTSAAKNMLKDLAGYDTIYIAGFAKDYCVADTVRDLLDAGLGPKLVFLEKGLACIDPNNETLKVYEEALSLGASREC